MRVLMTGGGTGGHVNPALAIANTIKANVPGSVIEYVGTSKGLENRLVERAGYKMHHVEIRGIKRSLSPANFKTLYYIMTAPSKAKKLIKEFKPDIVIGTGGYVCWPVVKAAAELGIPTALHESNAVPGVAVKALASKVDRIYINFEATAEYIADKSKVLHVGNPLLSMFSSPSDPETAKREIGVPDGCGYMLLSYGGSLGAAKINEAMLSFMKNVSSKRRDLYHVHATGTSAYESFREKFAEYGLDDCPNICLCEYIYDMPLRMAAADAVVCRAGAMTVSELSRSGKCAVFIPSPNVTNNHQYKNAKVLADADAALLFEERDLGESFENELSRLLSPECDGKRADMSEKIKTFSIADSNKLILEDILRLVKKKSGPTA
ncbi:MAG: UDP-N-acetylglucosamine--N-acetylmuramyl-(pentapeptide) pyrophosphoryl-undecaprenol N-acetylglucosamine transferase [Clostridia bacterium]|nr:UDP-N-acetylglucosamine--N-acetylmuramyl-(pentapeptide) pyrophosphoryl-undecaprenol N-acetylglucosamine transferase [Clostridia bacterium]